MGFSTVSGPFAVGPTKEGDKANTGLVMAAQQGVITFSDTTAKVLFRLPPGSFIVDFGMLTTVAFNSGTNNTVTIRTKASSPVNLAVRAETGAPIAVGFTAPTLQTSTEALAAFANTGEVDLEIEVLFAGTGSAATTGSAIITCMYVQRAKDGSMRPKSA